MRTLTFILPYSKQGDALEAPNGIPNNVFALGLSAAFWKFIPVASSEVPGAPVTKDAYFTLQHVDTKLFLHSLTDQERFVSICLTVPSSHTKFICTHLSQLPLYNHSGRVK